MQLRVENLLLARHYVALEQLLLHVLEAEARYRLREALSGLALLAEEQDGLLYSIEGLFLRREYLRERAARRGGLSPASAYIYLVSARSLRHRVEVAFSDAMAAVVAFVAVYLKHAVDELRRSDGARGLDGAFLAAVAAVLVELGHELAYYADVVEVWLDAVVRASADRYLELVRQAHLTVALVEALVYLLRDGEAVYEAVLAGRSLARDDGAHLRAGAARFEAGLRDEGAELLYLVEGHALALDRLARRERHYAVAVELRRLG